MAEALLDIPNTEAPESDAPAAVEATPEVRPLGKPATPDKGGFIWGTGRRKAAIARVRVKPAAEKGKGRFLVNNKPIEEYFTELRDQQAVVAPLKATQTEGALDIFVNAKGGGYMGQAGAVVLGVARALKGYDPTLEPILRDNEFLTRDSRRVERKKYGQPGARARFQFSKR